VSTYGIIFLGTPHNGADPAKWGHMLQSMCSVLFSRKILDTEPQLVTALQTQSETLQNINIGFLNIMHNFHICFFHEAVKTDLGVTQDFVRFLFPFLAPKWNSRYQVLTRRYI
jgi:hypothetical protein